MRKRLTQGAVVTLGLALSACAQFGGPQGDAAPVASVTTPVAWTRSDPAITASLRSLGRSAVPTYAVYHPDAITREPLILTELLTLEKMRLALESTQ